MGQLLFLVICAVFNHLDGAKLSTLSFRNRCQAEEETRGDDGGDKERSSGDDEEDRAELRAEESPSPRPQTTNQPRLPCRGLASPPPPGMMVNPAMLAPPPMFPNAASSKSIEESLAGNNLFFFGDVSVAHHPEAAPVPMIIPMVYLLPSPPTNQSKYQL